MENQSSDWVSLQRETLALCQKLIESFQLERIHLIRFELDELVRNNLQKQMLVKELKLKREKLIKISSIATEQSVYREQWQQSWEKLWACCQQNQRLIHRSLLYLELFVSHLRKFFGGNPIYSNQGKTIDLGKQGKVVQLSY